MLEKHIPPHTDTRYRNIMVAFLISLSLFFLSALLAKSPGSYGLMLTATGLLIYCIIRTFKKEPKYETQ